MCVGRKQSAPTIELREHRNIATIRRRAIFLERLFRELIDVNPAERLKPLWDGLSGIKACHDPCFPTLLLPTRFQFQELFAIRRKERERQAVFKLYDGNQTRFRNLDDALLKALVPEPPRPISRSNKSSP
jgi:hypothetical protein